MTKGARFPYFEVLFDLPKGRLKPVKGPGELSAIA
jgi:hypothetical protein